LKDGQWPDPSDCKTYFLCRGVGSPWGEQKREVCYAGKITNNRIANQSYLSGSYFDPNEKTCKWVGADKVCFFFCCIFSYFASYFLQINCEELVEGYENPIAGVVQSTANDDDDGEDEDITGDMGTSSKKGKSSSSSSKSISILSRSISEYDTCAPEKSVDFDPVQGN